ncbi:NUDIX domain-containing protein [Paenibacillus wulumuqiensis]|uniref:NUDIX domain-containing protein n=1 Tax=Paenibacillus wulumuqiensis TaxID=1567107 RepID=UPI0006195B87|nr:NUDIX domain-containing protein [Paenibacillus wulumuqiensis]
MGIRTTCLCLIQYNDHYLFQETLLKSSGRIMYRPVGGTMEPGEHSRQTVIREVREEIGADLVDPVLRYIIENHYEIPAHEAAEQSAQAAQPAEDTVIKANELCFIYTASLKDQSLYKQPHITGVEGDHTYTAVWKTLREIQQDTSAVLVPSNLLELLLAEQEGRTYESPLHHLIRT